MQIVLVVVIVLAGLAAAYVAYQSVVGGPGAVRRGFRALPVSTLEEGPGVRRLSGVARALGDPPQSEASGRSYLARDLRIVASDGGSPGNSTRGAQQAVDFLLDDGTGVALVRAQEGRVELSRDFEAPRTTLDQAPWADALLRAGGYSNGSPSTCRLRIYEGVLAPGDRAGVVGSVEPPDAAARAAGATAIVRPADGVELLIRAEDASSDAP